MDPLRGVAPVLLAVFALAFAASVFAGGFYDLMVWSPIGLGLLALLLALVVGAPSRVRGPAAAALAALVMLWLWSGISASWAESDEQSHIATARWATYAALFGVLLLLLRDGRHRLWVLGLTAAGVLAVGLFVTGTMLVGDAGSLFVGGRLRDPLGYSNGQGGYFLIGFWPLVALAELARKPLLAGFGMAGAFLVACLLLVGQTRGVLPAVAVSAVAVLLLIPGRGRRLWVLIIIAGGLAAISQPLLDVYRETPAAAGQLAGPPSDVAENAATAILMGAVVLGALWMGIHYLISGPLRRHSEDRGADSLLPRLGTAAAIAIVAAAAITVAAVGDPIDRIDREYDEFVNLRLEGTQSDSRFLSGGGYRYDYWRVALNQFESQPLRGVGSGSYDTTYFRERATREAVRQPHSLPLQTLSELGLIGALFLLAFVLSVLAGLWANARAARSDQFERVVAVAAGGAFIAWLAHTSVDWLHIIPGVTGMALIGAAALVSPAVTTRPGSRDRRQMAVVAGAVLAVVLGAHTVARPAAANFLRVEARDQLASDPVTALRRANQSLSIQGDSLRARYVKSAAYARLGRYQPAHDTLREAARLEPHDHLPWALLGDVAARHRDLGLARRYYARASRLNPKDLRLREVAKDPRITVAEAREADALQLQDEAGR